MQDRPRRARGVAPLPLPPLALVLAAAAGAAEGEELVVEAAGRTSPAHGVEAADLAAAGAEDLADAIELLAGVGVRVGGQGEARVDVRGSKQRASCVTLDGIPVVDPWDGAFDLAAVPLSQVERVRYEPGPAPDLPGCSAGVVRVVLRSRGERGAEGEVEAGTGWRVGLVGEVRPWASTGLGLVGRTRRGWPVPGSFTPMNAEDGGSRDLSDADVLAASLHGVHQGEHLVVRGGWHGLASRAGVPPDTSMVPRFRRADPVLRQQLGLRAAWQPHPDLAVTGGLGGAYVHLRTRAFESAALGEPTREDVVDAGHGRASAQVEGRATPWLHLGGGGALTGAGGRVRAAAGEAERQAGVQALEGSLTASAAARGEVPVSAALVGGAHLWGGGITPVGRAELRWSPGAVGIRAAVARTARAPTLRERADPERGNPDLRTEVVEVAEAGVEGHLDGVRWDLTGWAKRVDGWIASPDDGYGDKQYTNLDHVAFRGLDAGVAWEPVPEVRLRAAWSWGARLAGAVDTVPAHQGRLTARWRGPWRLVADLDLSATSSWDWGTVVLDPHLVADVQLEKGLGERAWVRIRVDNLFDALYQERPLEPRPGRVILVSVGGRTWTRG